MITGELKNKNGKNPDPNVIHPIAGYEKEIYVKPTITKQNIVLEKVRKELRDRL
ncbi:MAG: hypothetical protein IJR10_01865 [Clostridia bacterium]|nr:hypothetical protein [Clostridia bacterium]